jgi:hypothetical protein
MNSQNFYSLKESYSNVYQDQKLDEVSKELASRVVNARIERTGAASDREMKARTPQNVRDTVAAADKEARAKKLAAGVRRRRSANEEFELWVNGLVEEGYDLSEYTWDEIFDIYEAEGSYGQTPTARKSYGDLANKRRSTPASGFAKRGEKTTKVKSAEKHFNRTGNPDAGNRGKKSTKPSWDSGKRSGMTQKDRDHSRGEYEYGHTGYDPSFDGGPSAPGGKPKGKKLERQKKTGVSAESYDIYDVILSHLLDEGYVDTQQAAEAIMVNMSEEWRQSIMEGDALRNTIKYLEGKRDSMNAKRPGSANTAPDGKQSVGAAAYKAYQRLRLEV